MVGLAALLAGCSQTGEAADPRSSWSQPRNATPSSTAVTGTRASEPTTVALTAACPLLSATELKRLLGASGSRTTVTATEDQPDTSGGSTTYTCIYGSKGNNPFALSVSEFTAENYTPASAIDAIGKAAKVETESVAGVGEAAVFYSLPDNTSILAAAKRSQGKLRTVLFAAPVIVPKQKFVDVEKLVLGRI
jgi:hypothetical protein